MTLEEALKFVLGEFSKDAQSQQVVTDAFKAHAQPVFQHVSNIGHGIATSQMQAKLTAAEGRVTAAEERARVAEEAAAKAAEKAPDVAAVRSQYQTEIAENKRKADAALKQAQDEAQALRNAVVVDKLTELLTDKSGPNMSAKYARMRAEQEVAAGRVKVTPGEKPGSVKWEVMQKDKPEVPVSVASGKDPLTALVGEITADPEAKEFMLSKVDGGSGSRTNANGGGTSPDQPAALKQFTESKAKAEEARHKLNPLENPVPAIGAVPVGSLPASI